jgi:hypothetical protein
MPRKMFGELDEGDSAGVEHFDHLGEVGDRAGQAVDLVDGNLTTAHGRVRVLILRRTGRPRSAEMKRRAIKRNRKK